MYELFVLACLMAKPDMCVTLKDLYGPYKVHDKCLARAYEIAKGMPIHMPDYYPKSYKCVDMDNADKVQTTWQQRNVED
tara:strand:+ start:1521 stop:1757 length:237 start_codon:yes stop_codon:yes gene_type:complete